MIKKSRNFWITLVVFSLIGQVAWVVENMYFNVFIYNMFGASPSDISLMVGASSVSAALTTVFIGALSDKVGKRKIFICLGYILWGVSILSFAFVRRDVVSGIFSSAVSVSAICITIAIVLDCVMTFFGSSANDACFNAWLTDSTSDGGRGSAEGVNSMMPLMAILVVFGGFMSFDLTTPSSWTTIFCIIGGVVILIGALGFFLIEDDYSRREENTSYFKNIVYGFKPSVVSANKTLYVSLGCFALFGISIQIFMPYLIIYYQVALKMNDYVLIMAPAIIIAGVATAFYGRYYDKVGFFKSLIPTLASLAFGYTLLILFQDTVMVFLGSLLMMTGYLTGMAVFGAMIRDYTPLGKAGMFQGLRIFAQVLIPGIIGPMIGAWVLSDAEVMVNSDGTTSFIPNANIFISALVVALLVAILAFALRPKFFKNNDKGEQKNESL